MFEAAGLLEGEARELNRGWEKFVSTALPYVTLKAGYDESDELLAALKMHVRKEIGPIAAPEVIQFAPGLPKTRSGKIMRRILRKIASDEVESLGDTSTLADPSVVNELIDGKKRLFGK